MVNRAAFLRIIGKYDCQLLIDHCLLLLCRAPLPTRVARRPPPPTPPATDAPATDSRRHGRPPPTDARAHRARAHVTLWGVWACRPSRATSRTFSGARS